jgi:hypothetical protein
MNNKDNNVPLQIMDTNKILFELTKYQMKDIPVDKKLLLNDLKRISKYLTNSIFTNNITDCAIWTGYVTVIKNDEKNSYVNFYYRGKKYALHRLLYQNFIGELSDSEYIKFRCANKGKCCNINHFYKIHNDDNYCHENKNYRTLTPTGTGLTTIEEETDEKIIKKPTKKHIIVDFNL